MIETHNSENGGSTNPIILELKGGRSGVLSLAASCSTAARLYGTPPEFKCFESIVPDFYNSYFEIENILCEDNHDAFIFTSLVQKTKKIISNIPDNLKLDFIENLTLRIASHKIQKLKELKYDDSYFIDNTPRHYGIHTEQSRWVKAPKENIDIKLNLLTEYDKWLSNEKEQYKEKPMIPFKSNSNSNDGVLVRDDYFQILTEIYNLHRNTLSEYLESRCKQLLPMNPQFIECLYKDISKVLEDVHGPDDLDLDISTGDIEFEYGDIRVTGKPTIFDDATIFLWMRLSEQFIEKYGVLKLGEALETYQTNILNRDDYTPEYAKKIAELNQKLKNPNGPETEEEKNEIKNDETPKLSLSDFTISNDAYKAIINLLTDKGHCQKDTLKWKDKAKGNKGFLIAIIKDLRTKGYYKDGINPSNDDYKSIAKNTFDWTGSIDTVKKAKPENFQLDFIPSYKSK